MRAPFQIFTVIYHKKVRRIYLEKILVCVIILTIISELCACKKKVSNSQNKIDFPQIAQEIHGTVPFEFELGNQKNELGKEIGLYKIKPRRTIKNSEYYDGYLFKLFCGNIIRSTEYKQYTRYTCGDGDTLEIYNSGSFIFSHNRDCTKVINIPDEQVVELAEEYLKNNDLLPNGFTIGKSLGGTYDENGKPLIKSVCFCREIGGYEVYGRSDITVEVDAQGIDAIYSIYSDYEFERNIRCLSYNELIDIDPLKEGQIVYDATKLNAEVSKIIIKEFKIMYYDSPINQPELSYIQPVYQFKGVAVDSEGNGTDCYWTISAIAY